MKLRSLVAIGSATAAAMPSSTAAAPDLNSLCADGGTFLPGPCGPYSACHRCYHLGSAGGSCDGACASVGSSCDEAGTSALGSLGDMRSCLAAAGAMGLEWEPHGTYVGENVGCAWLGGSDDASRSWVLRLVDASRATTCGAAELGGGRRRICACDLRGGAEASPALLSADGGETCLDLGGGGGGCAAFALLGERLAALPEATECVGAAAEGGGGDGVAAWEMVPCDGGSASRFRLAFDRYVADAAGSEALDRFGAPCAPLDLSSIPAFARPASERGGIGYDLSLYDQTDCASRAVPAGETCEVRCLNGYASAAFACPAGNVDPTQPPLAPDLPLCASNAFAGDRPSLYGVPTSESLRVWAVSARRGGRLWVVVAEASVGPLRTAGEVRGCAAPQCAACRIDGAATDGIYLRELDGCGLVEGAAYRLHFYVASEAGDDDGTIATYEFEVPNVACPVAVEPERTIWGKVLPAGKQNGRFFWGSCFYVADGQESCETFCRDKLSGASCDVPGLLAVGSCAPDAQSCSQLVHAMGLPFEFDERVYTYGDDSSGCTWYHGSEGANAEFGVQRFVRDRDARNPTECDEENGDVNRHRICSCEAPESFALDSAVRPRKLLSVKTGLLLAGVDHRSLRGNAAAVRALERVFLDLTGAAAGDASARVIDEGAADGGGPAACEALVPEPNLPGARRLRASSSRVWVYVGANDEGAANHIALNIRGAVDSGDLARRAGDALTDSGVAVSSVRVAGTTPEPSAAPSGAPTAEPSLSPSPTTSPPTTSPAAAAPTPSPASSADGYESAGHFRQELLLPSSALSARGLRGAFERAVESLTPLYGAHARTGGDVDAFATFVDLEIIDGADRRFQESSDEASRVRVEYIVQYVSPDVDVSGYPLLLKEFLSSRENRNVLEERLIAEGVPVVPGSASEAAFLGDDERESAAPAPRQQKDEGSGAASVVGAVVGAVCGALLLGAFLLLRRRRRIKRRKKIPVVHAVAVDDAAGGQDRNDIVVEAFAVEDEGVATDPDDSSRQPERLETSASNTAMTLPDAEAGSNAVRTERAGFGSEAAERRSTGGERRAQLRTQLRTDEKASLKRQKKGKKEHMTSEVIANAAPRAQVIVRSKPEGPEIFTDVVEL